MYMYINEQIIEEKKASISPFDHGFLYGLGLFETFRVYRGHPFLLDDHLARLNAGLEQIGISSFYKREDILPLLARLLSANRLENAYIRLNVSAGPHEVGLRLEPYESPNLLIFVKPLGDAPELTEKTAVSLNLRRNTPEGEGRLKSHHYLNNVLAKKEIGDAPGTEGVFLTEEGFLAEGVVSNLFWLKSGTLYTPSLETGILNGITRQFVMKLAECSGFKIETGFYRTGDISGVEEVFLTNSIQEIVAVRSFFGTGMPGRNGQAVKRLHEQYALFRESLWSRSELSLEDGMNGWN
ncbi:aminodeoxychorismate lyase [Mesobacillus zeae]|uniref:4-amino-4-deoxychorismate lyase n=1 Tax=Mesobacillus zeae TaxID=1917180 RepID=A0A398BMD6_9BACI|nr:aminodeoxychorismate lyase [Mesobacillus zeae]RID88556.1 4-amino-4-deoxychorismate lyase [Mesobacillus zeae]